MSDVFDYQSAAKQVLKTEIAGLVELEKFINDDFSRACELILSNSLGKVVVMGMGKSGHIGKKMAATLASTGSSAFFVHPGEASHGDLGMIEEQDIVIAISYSGESSEILSLFPILKRRAIRVISMTGNPASSMAQLSDIHLQVTVPEEACPLGLAPTSSTTATLVLGDALAIALLQARGFTKEDFAMSHPGGALGRKLLLLLEDIMHTGQELPRVSPNALIRDALLEISQKGLGMTTIVDENNHLLGLFTDGDLRRILDKKIDIHSSQIKNVMTHNPTTSSPKTLAVEGLNLMQDKRINGLVLVDAENKLVGALNMHDLLKAGVM
ncbi:KpsF/GutQ family sugar-phosphate isomerase [Vibrio sp.]|uniref:Arabinose 5-phosphate isomerase n=1 Tax=Vibrio viridaestus TaxID=2487322 RepID=A0A3N9U192_9VIBR|nr:KpsF/GutQ family sugar-phosphate isomerase [Vibrio viridaestus]MDC0611300.1 KpsF/GutQ family sugar-phosphate isomerase [Vibrio sp.]RQW61556.1 KpsF/GutQ family sugar-phosphate isomerase [Vibrio viridaestus]